MEVRIEPERPEDRNTPFHMKITTMRHVAKSKSGNDCTLACGHIVRMYGNPELADGKVLCILCRDAAGGK